MGGSGVASGGQKSGDPCKDARAASLKCIEDNYTQKDNCSTMFKEYKDCKAQAYKDARAARIRARDGRDARPSHQSYIKLYRSAKNHIYK